MRTLANISQFESLQPVFNTSACGGVGMFDPPEKQMELLDAEMLSLFRRYAEQYAEAKSKLNSMGMEVISEIPAFDKFARGETVTKEDIVGDTKS